jgi:glycosyltransferase involved in cell wall biosynthesis
MSSARTQPLVTVIIPTYNRAYILSRAIDSVLAQDYQNVEVLVVDDGSTDDTPALIACSTDLRVRSVRHEANLGVCAAHNTGFDNMRGEWYAVLGSDDELRPNAISRLLSVIQEIDSSIDQVICNAEDSITGRPTGWGMEHEGYVDERTVVFTGDMWSLSRTSTLGDDRLDTRLHGLEELLWYKLAERQKRYYISDRLAVFHKEGHDRITGAGRGSRHESYVILLEEEPGLLEPLARRAPEARARFWFDAALECCWMGDRPHARRSLAELEATGAASAARVSLLRLGIVTGRWFFRPTVRLITSVRDLVRRSRENRA